MPVIVNPQYDDPGFGQIAGNMATALFGSASDRADRDLRAAQLREAMAKASVYDTEAQRGQVSLGAYRQLPDIFRRRVRLPGESIDAYNARTAADQGALLQAGAPTSTAEDLAKASNTGLAYGLLQSTDAGDLRRATVAQGGIPTAGAAYTPGEVQAQQQAAYDKAVREAQIKEQADIAVANIGAATTRRGQDIDYNAKIYGYNRQNPYAGLKIGKDETFIPAPGTNLDMTRAIRPGASGAPNVLKSITPEESNLMANEAYKGYPGLTKVDKKGRLVLDPTLSTADNLSPETLQRAKAAGEAAYLASGKMQDGVRAMQQAMGIPVGTPYVVGGGKVFGFGREPYGHFDYAAGTENPPSTNTPTASPAAPQPQSAGKTPVVQAVAGPTSQAATPYRIPARPAAAAPVRVTSDAEYNALPSNASYIAPDGSVRTKAAAAPAAAPSPIAAAITAPTPPASGTNYLTPTESVTVSAERPKPAPAPAKVAKVAPPVTAQVFNPPQRFASESAARTALTSTDYGVRAKAREFLGLTPEAKPALDVPQFQDLKTAMSYANNPAADPATRQAANEFVNRYYGGAAPAPKRFLPTTFTDAKDANFVLTHSKNPAEIQNAQNFFRNQQMGG